MKIIVFGANGAVGSEIVKQALELGYIVTAFVRSAEKLGALHHKNLRIELGDAAQKEDVEKAINGHDAVLCALGDGRKGIIRTTGTRNIIVAMEQLHVQRFICQTTLGMGDSYHNLNAFWKYFMFGFFLKRAFEDHKQQEQLIANTNLAYTLVRPSALTDGGITNQFKRGFGADQKKLTLKISKADVASFMLAQLQSKQYIQKSVSISN
ncbi:NAD(P)-dependent oxidoreductase [Neptunitalea lumnitzerae]|uniref:NAD-dependent epimerase n=1 Tax=Neptunitalea lumnitzerae TaxID=2965509 RepID=A0ABQ5MLS0_9FLAO|nr:SDR family oxidoreductase [Neptunitalea sp. Y10]GLB50339.1 NAD-dependent epimerase [Neptunitalea sp. Y10]